MRWMLLLLTVLSPLAAQQKSVAWFPGSFDQALVEARERNVPLLVAFNQDGEESNESIVEVLYGDATFIKLTSRCVALMASIHQHDPVNIGKEERCSRFPALTCAQHRVAETKAREKCWGDKPVSTPSHVVLLPDGVEVARLLDMVGAGDIESALNAGRKKIGVGLSAEQVAAARGALKAGAAALKSGDIAAAQTALAVIDKECAGTPFLKNADPLRAGLTAALDSVVESCKALASKGETLAALQAIDAGRGLMANGPQAALLRKLEADILRTAEGRAAKKALEAEARVRPVFEAAAANDAKREYARAAAGFLRVVREAPKTTLAQQASARLDAFAADKDIAVLCAAVLVEHRAEVAYQAARALLDAGKAQEGKAALAEIVKQWPATQAGLRAKKLLGE